MTTAYLPAPWPGDGMIMLDGYGAMRGFLLHHRPNLYNGQEAMFGCLHVKGKRPVTRRWRDRSQSGGSTGMALTGVAAKRPFTASA